MSFKTYTLPVGDRTLTFQRMSKADAESTGGHIRKVVQLSKYSREITNHLNDDHTALVENSWVMFSPFGGMQNIGEEAEAARKKLLDELPDLITPENRDEIKRLCNEYFLKYVPVTDMRKTLETALADYADMLERDAARETTRKAEALSAAVVAQEGILVRRNEEHNGIEIVFPAKPVEDIRNAMKGHGFRWSGGQGLWYTKFTPEKLEFAKKLAGYVE